MTFNNWRKQFPEFEEAWQESIIISQEFCENLALRGAAGLVKNFNLGALALIMNNKFSDEYKRNHNGQSSEPTNTTINIVNMSPEEIRYKIAQKQEFLMQRGQIPLSKEPIIIDADDSTE